MGAPFFSESPLSLPPPPSTPQPPDLQMLEPEKASGASLHHLQGLWREKGVLPAKGRDEQGQTEIRFPDTHTHTQGPEPPRAPFSRTKNYALRVF